MLTTPVVTGLVVASLIFAIVLGNIKKINIGIIALACAWIIACWLGGNFASKVTALFPTKVVMYLICITFFYGFAISNGTMQKLGDKIIYAFRNHVKLIPFVIPLAAMIIAGCGGGGLMGVIVMAPIAFLLAERIGMNPILALSGVLMLAPVGGTTFWSVGGVASRGVASQTFDPTQALSMVQTHSIAYAIVAISFYIVLYIVLKGWKVSGDLSGLTKPDPMNTSQKITFWMIVSMIILIVVPGIVNIVFPNPITQYLGNFVFEIQVMCVILGTVCSLAGIADPVDIIKNQIPWNLILVIGGVGTLVGVATMYGATEMVASFIGSNISGNAAVVLMDAIGGVMSLFTDGLGVGLPTFYPMIPTIAASAGVSVTPLFVAFTMGTWITAMSPLSTSGALGLSFATEDSNKNKLFAQQLTIAIAYGAWEVLFAVFGFFTLFA